MPVPPQNPLARVKQEFGGKDKLVDKIVGLIDAGDESKDDLRKRLAGFPNLEFVKVAGHAGVPENERCDELARAAIMRRA